MTVALFIIWAESSLKENDSWMCSIQLSYLHDYMYKEGRSMAQLFAEHLAKCVLFASVEMADESQS